MELLQQHMPGYRINEYFLVLPLPEDLRQKIAKVREGFAVQYRHPSSRTLKSHLTLVSFTGLEMMEEKIASRIAAICMGMVPFKIELRDYGSFPSHTIHINVVSRLPVLQLIRELKDAQRLMKLNSENKPHFIEEPHIAIARKLKPWQYESGWKEFAHRQFTGRFIADRILLLKRRKGETGACQIAGSFEFRNLPVTTRQGHLF